MKNYLHYSRNFSNRTQAILYYILTCFLVSVLITIVRHLSSNFNVFFIVMMRNIFAFLFFIPFMIKNPKILFKTDKIHLHVLRNVNGIVAMVVWFYTVTLISLPQAVSFTFIVPIITTFFAMIFLKEKVSTKIWITLFSGFIGILIIIRPGFNEFKLAYCFAILTTILWSVSNLIVKQMTNTDKPETIVAYMSCIMLFLSIPLGFLNAKSMHYEDIFWFAMLGLFSNLAHMSMSTSYSKSSLSTLQPFDFTRLIFISIISYFLFGEVIDFFSCVGALIIFISGVFSTKFSNNKA